MRAVINIHLEAAAAELVRLACTLYVAECRRRSSCCRHVITTKTFLSVLESSETILEARTCFFADRRRHGRAGESVVIHSGPGRVVNPTSNIIGGVFLFGILKASSGGRRVVDFDGCRSPARQGCISGTGLVALAVRKPLTAGELVRAEAGFGARHVSYKPNTGAAECCLLFPFSTPLSE